MMRLLLCGALPALYRHEGRDLSLAAVPPYFHFPFRKRSSLAAAQLPQAMMN